MSQNTRIATQKSLVPPNQTLPFTQAYQNDHKVKNRSKNERRNAMQFKLCSFSSYLQSIKAEFTKAYDLITICTDVLSLLQCYAVCCSAM